MSSNDDSRKRFECHPDYPFFKVGLLKEYTGDFGNTDEWILLIDNERSHIVYESKESAIKMLMSVCILKAMGIHFP